MWCYNYFVVDYLKQEGRFIHVSCWVFLTVHVALRVQVLVSKYLVFITLAHIFSPSVGPGHAKSNCSFRHVRMSAHIRATYLWFSWNLISGNFTKISIYTDFVSSRTTITHFAWTPTYLYDAVARFTVQIREILCLKSERAKWIRKCGLICCYDTEGTSPTPETEKSLGVSYIIC
jgi:hypothetical protein